MTITTLGKGQLAKMYCIDTITFKAWCIRANLFTIQYYDSVRLFTPAEVQKIVNHLGEPSTDTESKK